MILADSSIWINHLRLANLELARLIRGDLILSHPYVVGELALGSIKNRGLVVAQVAKLPSATVAQHQEVMALIERHALHGSGVGYMDAHLLASVLLTRGARLWTRDRRLHAAAERLGVAAKLAHGGRSAVTQVESGVGEEEV